MIALALAIPAPADGSMPPRPRDLLDKLPVATSNTGWFVRQALSEIDATAPLQWPPPPPPDSSRNALVALVNAPTNEFSAPPLLVTRIAGLAGGEELSDEQVETRFEVVRVRDTITRADRLFRDQQATNAIAALKDLLPVIRTTSLQVTILNRLAAYHFRLQLYDTAVSFMRRAHEVDPSDLVTGCNLAATLLQRGQAEEALRILETIPEGAIDRPTLVFSLQFNIACANSLLGNSEQALRHLARAVQADPASAAVSLGDPQLDNVRADDRFVALRKALEDYVRRAEQRPAQNTP